MKIIIGLYDKSLSRKLAILLSSKKLDVIEAESFEEIPKISARHEKILLISEETSLSFYQSFTKKIPTILLIHPHLSTTELLNLQNFGINHVISYSESADELFESICGILDQKKDYDSKLMGITTMHKDTAIHIPFEKKWIYGELKGFNSAKVAISIDQVNYHSIINKNDNGESILMYLQGLNVRAYVDFVSQQDDTFVFRYRKMSKSDAQRLAFYLYHCKNKETIDVN